MEKTIYSQRSGNFLSKEAMHVRQYALTNDIKCVTFNHVDELSTEEIQESYLIEGSVETIQMALRRIGKTAPEPDYYPEILQHTDFMNRRVWKSTLEELEKHHFTQPIFIKSHEWKKITGIVIMPNQRDSFESFDKNTKIWCGDMINIIAEWRVYVHHDRIVAVGRYDENPNNDLKLDFNVINKAIDLMKNKRVSYAFDWGLTEFGTTELIENNDAWAIGAYDGIDYKQYTHFLIDRWNELTK